MVNRRILEGGFRRVRGSWAHGDVASRNQAVELGKAGVKFTFWTGQIGSDLNAVKNEIKATNALHPGTIDAIEGPNEQDNDPRLRAFVQQYSQVMRSDPATAKLRIYGPSMANVGSADPYRNLGDISSWVDAANVHNYPGGRMMSDAYLDSIFAFTRHNVGATGKVMASKLGYSTATSASSQPHPAVPEDVQAVLVPRIYLEHYRRGIFESNIYELLDESGHASPWEARFGLLRSDFTPKPAFTAMSNLMHLLADSGGTFPAGKLNVTLTGTDGATRTLLLQKRDGSFWLVIWQQTEIWDRVTKKYTGARDISVRLTVPATTTATSYRPVTGRGAVATSTGTSFTVPSGVAPTVVKLQRAR